MNFNVKPLMVDTNYGRDALCTRRKKVLRLFTYVYWSIPNK